MGADVEDHIKARHVLELSHFGLPEGDEVVFRLCSEKPLM